MSEPISNSNTGSQDPSGGGASGEEFDPLDHQADDGAVPQSTTPTGDIPETQQEGPAFPPDLAEALRRERLPTVQGETPEAAYIRLSTHLQARNRKLYTDLKEGERQSRQQQAELRQMLEPMLRDYYQRQRHAQIEEQAAQIPPKDSPEYQVWLLEESLRRDDERRQQEEQAALTWQEQQALTQQQQRLAAVDGAGFQKVAEGLGLVQGAEPDPEFQHAYNIFSEGAMIAARDYFPDATDEQLQEFVALSQQLDIRRAEQGGVDYRDLLKRRLNAQIDGLVRLGLVQRAAGNGSVGNGQVTTPATSSGNGNAVQPTVAQRVQNQAAAAAKRGPSAVPSSTRPTQLPGQMPDPNKFDSDEDFVEAALSGILGNEEQRTSMHRKQR
jgi:hypothetical protein